MLIISAGFQTIPAKLINLIGPFKFLNTFFFPILVLNRECLFASFQIGGCFCFYYFDLVPHFFRLAIFHFVRNGYHHGSFFLSFEINLFPFFLKFNCNHGFLAAPYFYLFGFSDNFRFSNCRISTTKINGNLLCLNLGRNLCLLPTSHCQH